MSDLDAIYERNAAYVETFDKGDLQLPPNLKTLVICCVDARMVPSAFAGLTEGEALMMRTVGARLSDTAITEAIMLYWLLYGGSGGKVELDVAVIGHTDCGMERLANPEVGSRFAERMGQAVVDAYVIHDADDAVKRDIAKLEADPRKPSGMNVSGHLYDVRTGRLRRVENR